MSRHALLANRDISLPVVGSLNNNQSPCRGREGIGKSYAGTCEKLLQVKDGKNVFGMLVHIRRLKPVDRITRVCSASLLPDGRLTAKSMEKNGSFDFSDVFRTRNSSSGVGNHPRYWYPHVVRWPVWSTWIACLHVGTGFGIVCGFVLSRNPRAHRVYEDTGADKPWAVAELHVATELYVSYPRMSTILVACLVDMTRLQSIDSMSVEGNGEKINQRFECSPWNSSTWMCLTQNL